MWEIVVNSFVVIFSVWFVCCSCWYFFFSWILRTYERRCKINPLILEEHNIHFNRSKPLPFLRKDYFFFHSLHLCFLLSGYLRMNSSAFSFSNDILLFLLQFFFCNKTLFITRRFEWQECWYYHLVFHHWCGKISSFWSKQTVKNRIKHQSPPEESLEFILMWLFNHWFWLKMKRKLHDLPLKTNIFAIKNATDMTNDYNSSEQKAWFWL